MFRTFLVAVRGASPRGEFGEVMGRIAELYRSRLIWATVQSADELGGVASYRVAQSIEPSSDVQTSNSSESRRSIILVGEFVPVVCDKGHEADLIVVWHEGLSGPDGNPVLEDLGSLVRQAPRPVWLYREPVRFPAHILVAYDGSAHSGRALHMAANLAETLGARLTILNVNESRDPVAQDLVLARAVGYCEPYRVTMERVGVFGSAAESIRAYAQSSKCDLLVVGAAGVGYLRGLLFGSVAGELVAHAPCSVLVAK